MLPKGSLHFKYVPKKETKQIKTNEEGWHKRRFKLYNRNKTCFLFPCLFIFHHINIAKHT